MKGDKARSSRLKFVVLAMSLSLLAGCGQEIRQDMTVVKEGLVCEKGSEKPFSGYVVGRGREDYRRQTMRYKKRYKNGRLHGHTKYWYKNGQLESAEPYKNGVLHGVIVRYYENGQVRAKVPFTNGKRGGFSGERFWDEDGRRVE